MVSSRSFCKKLSNKKFQRSPKNEDIQVLTDRLTRNLLCSHFVSEAYLPFLIVFCYLIHNLNGFLVSLIAKYYGAIFKCKKFNYNVVNLSFQIYVILTCLVQPRPMGLLSYYMTKGPGDEIDVWWTKKVLFLKNSLFDLLCQKPATICPGLTNQGTHFFIRN